VAESRRHGSGFLIVGFIVPQAQFSCRCTLALDPRVYLHMFVERTSESRSFAKRPDRMGEKQLGGIVDSCFAVACR
jgi:hypothetical protein